MKKAMNQSMMTLILNGISILALLFLLLSLFSYSKMSEQINTANAERFDLTYNANRFMNGSAYLTNEVRAYAATGDKQHYDNYWNEINQLKNRDQGVAAMQEIGITAEEQALIDEMSSISNKLVPLEEEAMNQVAAGDSTSAINYVYGLEYSTSIAKINSIKEEFLADLDQRTSAQVAEVVREENAIKIRMFAALALVAVLQLSSMIVVRKRVLRPVVSVRDQMKEISQGNLSADFTLEGDTSEIGMLVQSIHETKHELKRYIHDIDDKLSQMAEGNMDLDVGDDYRGEFRPIQKAMAQILDALNKALSRIDTTAEQVLAESRKVAAGAQSMSSGTVEQAAAVEELTASVQDISRQVGSTSLDADNAQSYSAEAIGHLMRCNERMGDLTVAIEDISKASHEIGGIIKTIEDISFQTNILALNAAVEAARAGEAGKGFAVVAGEVQNLANKSNASAKSITELIENSMKLVKYGTTLSAETTEALAAVVASGQKTANVVDRIAESARQQAQSLDQVTQGMSQISQVVQSNAANAEESAASARELENQAEELKNSVQRFQLRGQRRRR